MYNLLWLIDMVLDNISVVYHAWLCVWLHNQDAPRELATAHYTNTNWILVTYLKDKTKHPFMGDNII